MCFYSASLQGNSMLRLSALVNPCRSYSLCDPCFYCSAIGYTSLEPPDTLNRVSFLLYLPEPAAFKLFSRSHVDRIRPI